VFIVDTGNGHREAVSSAPQPKPVEPPKEAPKEAPKAGK
jgi:hypothetical protein